MASASCALCCACVVHTRCRASRLASLLAFHPPTPPTYTIHNCADDDASVSVNGAAKHGVQHQREAHASRLQATAACDAVDATSGGAAAQPQRPQGDEAGTRCRYDGENEPVLSAPARVLQQYGQHVLRAGMHELSSAQGVAVHMVAISTRGDERIPVMAICHPRATLSILYSHGNATDMGEMRHVLIDLALNVGVNVIAYEYSGYGPTAGRVLPSETSVCAAAEAAYRWATSLPICPTPAHLILYGQSIGSGPTCYLASRYPCGGIILHSPLASGLRVVTDNRCLACMDIFDNLKRMPAIAVRVPACFIMHGIEDVEVPARHSHRLLEALHKRWPRDAAPSFPAWLAAGAGHNNLDTLYRLEYMSRLRAFMAHAARVSSLPYAPPETYIPLERAAAALRDLWSGSASRRGSASANTSVSGVHNPLAASPTSGVESVDAAAHGAMHGAGARSPASRVSRSGTPCSAAGSVGWLATDAEELHSHRPAAREGEE